jgi:hypothetical protein
VSVICCVLVMHILITIIPLMHVYGVFANMKFCQCCDVEHIKIFKQSSFFFSVQVDRVCIISNLVIFKFSSYFMSFILFYSEKK